MNDEQIEKICTTCKKKVNNFKIKNDGTQTNTCNNCLKVKAKYLKSHPDKRKKSIIKYEANNVDKIAKVKRKYRENNIHKRLLVGIKYRNKRLKFNSCDIDNDYMLHLVNAYKHCPCCNVEFVINTNFSQSNSITVDRIDVNLGYNKSNIILICHKCNAIKNNLTKNELLQLQQDDLQIHASDFNIEESRLKTIYYHKMSGAKKRNVLFDLTLNDVRNKIIKTCPILNIDLNYYNIKQSGNSPSFDRINPNIGYTNDNTRIISAKANRAKSNATKEEINKIVKFYSNFKF